ncbi:hypothetical protein Pmar_PMAR012229, partial [Perkinsus marinus ATCC 50983]
MWAVVDAGTKTEGGHSLAGRRQLNAKVQGAVAVYRDVMDTAAEKKPLNSSPGSVKTEASSQNTQKPINSVTEDTTYYRATQRAKQLTESCGVGTFDGDNGKFISFIDNLQSALRCIPFVSAAAKI